MPTAALPTEKDLLTASCHIGHRKEKWNPRMAPYLYGIQRGIHVFDLTQTRERLGQVCDALKALQALGKTVLFVSTKQQTIPLIEQIGTALGQPTVTKKWIPGLLTNWSNMKRRLKYYLDLQRSFQTGEVEKYTKKEQTGLRKKLAKLDAALSGVAGMTQLPDAVFIVDAVRDNVAVREARKLGLPLYGICDSNADPTDFTLCIPANDDALKSVTIILEAIKNALGDAPKKAPAARE